jgi:hypothetical protein
MIADNHFTRQYNPEDSSEHQQCIPYSETNSRLPSKEITRILWNQKTHYRCQQEVAMF